MFEVTHLSLKTFHVRTQVGVGRVELTQLTAVGGMVMMMRRWWRWWRWGSSTQMMTTLGTVLLSSLVTATGVR